MVPVGGGADVGQTGPEVRGGAVGRGVGGEFYWLLACRFDGGAAHIRPTFALGLESEQTVGLTVVLVSAGRQGEATPSCRAPWGGRSAYTTVCATRGCCLAQSHSFGPTCDYRRSRQTTRFRARIVGCAPSGFRAYSYAKVGAPGAKVAVSNRGQRSISDSSAFPSRQEKGTANITPTSSTVITVS